MHNIRSIRSYLEALNDVNLPDHVNYMAATLLSWLVHLRMLLNTMQLLNIGLLLNTMQLLNIMLLLKTMQLLNIRVLLNTMQLLNTMLLLMRTMVSWPV